MEGMQHGFGQQQQQQQQNNNKQLTTTLTKWCTGGGHATWVGSVTRKKKVRIPNPLMMNPGTRKDQPQGSALSSTSQSAQKDGITVPRMFPTEVWEFQMPMIRPRLQRGGGIATWRGVCLIWTSCNSLLIK